MADPTITREVALSEALDLVGNTESIASDNIRSMVSEWSGPFLIYDGDVSFDGDCEVGVKPTIIWGDLEVAGTIVDGTPAVPHLLVVLGNVRARNLASRSQIAISGDLDAENIVYGDSGGKHSLVVGGVTRARAIVNGAHWMHLLGGAEAQYIFGHIEGVAHSGFQAPELFLPPVLDLDDDLEEGVDATVDPKVMIAALRKGEEVLYANPTTRRRAMMESLESAADSEDKRRVISLEDAGLHEVPDEVFDATGLERLVLDFNDLTSLPERIGSLKSLKVLSVDNALMRRLPKAIGDLANLESLSLRFTRIREFPDSASKLENLRELYLTYSSLQDFPSPLRELPKLEKVSFWHCQPDDPERLATILEGLKGLSALRYLEFNQGEISSFPEALAHLTQLEELRVADLSLDDRALAEIHRFLPRVRVRTNF